MRMLKNEIGFNMIELMVVLAVIALLGAATAPSLKNWMRTYKTKGAARDIYSNLQTAKVSSVKENRQWKVAFKSGGSYDLIKCMTATCEIGTLNTDYAISSSVDFGREYDNAVKFSHPQSGTVFDNNPLIFNPNGLTNRGYVYMSDDSNTRFYRIGLPSFAGSIVIQQWNGSTWN